MDRVAWRGTVHGVEQSQPSFEARKPGMSDFSLRAMKISDGIFCLVATLWSSRATFMYYFS